MIGLRPDANIVVTTQVQDINTDLVQADMNYLLEEAVRRNPMVLSAIEEKNAAEAHLSLVEAEQQPTIGLIASGSQSLTPSTGSTTKQRIRSWSIGLQLKIPIFSGFSSFQSKQTAIAQRDFRIASITEIERKVSKNLWLQKEKIDTQLSNLKLTSQLLVATKEAYALAFGRYKSGVGTMLELLQAQKSLTDATLQKNKTISVILTSQSKLAAMIDRISY